MRLAKRAHEAASTRIARLVCDFVDRQSSRLESVGRLSHAKITQDDHRRSTHGPAESRYEGGPAEEGGTRQTLDRVWCARTRNHVGKCSRDLGIAQQREALVPEIERAKRATQERHDHLLQQCGTHRTEADFLRNEFRERRLERVVDLIAFLELLDDWRGQCSEQFGRGSPRGVEVSANEQDDGVRIRRDIATHGPGWEYLRATVDGLDDRARAAPRWDFDPEEGSRGKDDQRVRLQLDWLVVPDDHAASAGKIVVKPGGVDVAEFQAIAFADEALRKPDKLDHQCLEQAVEIRRSNPHEWRPVAHERDVIIVGNSARVHSAAPCIATHESIPSRDRRTSLRANLCWVPASVVTGALSPVVRWLEAPAGEYIVVAVAVSVAILCLTLLLRKVEDPGHEDLVNMFVHDMRAPLTVVMANLSMLREDVADSSESAENVDAAMAAALRVNRMANNLLDISRLEASRLPLQRSPTDIAEVARTVTRAMAALDPSRHIEIRARKPVVCVCDGELMRRIIENLVSNAIKHTDPCGHIVVQVSSETACVRVSVEDDGPGIAEESRDRIFERYSASSIQTRTGAHTVGLGLAFCKLAAAAHGGKIWVERVVPNGSRFVVEVPQH
jgi:signal transduction histidine kinase